MSDPIHVLITLPFPDELLTEVRGISPRLKIHVQPVKKAADISPQEWEPVEVLYTEHILPEPDWAPNLRWIQFHRAGVDHLIHHPVLGRAELALTTLSGAAATQVAEYVLLMLLALGHHLPALVRHQQRSEWVKDRWAHFTPIELRGSTVGIVGYGSVGRQVARLLHILGAVVLATKRDAMHPEDSGYFQEDQGDPAGDLVHRLYPPQALGSMLKECDFVVVAAPLTADTRHLIDAKALAAMKPSAFLVDVSRGGVVDQEALAKALHDNKLAGAALDVFAQEPLPHESPFWKMPNVLLSPHIAGISRAYDRRGLTLFAENIYRYLADMPLYNRIDLERGY